MSSVQQRKTARQAPVARTALEQVAAEVRADEMQEARVLLGQKPEAVQPVTSTVRAIGLAIVVVSNNLERLAEIRVEDEDWVERDVCVDIAVDLALKMVRNLRASKPMDFDQMSFEWAQISSIIDLANHAFSRPDALYGRTLSYLCRSFAVLGEMVELSDLEVAA